jgi:hypothetical protein
MKYGLVKCVCVLPSAISVPSENGRLQNNVYTSCSTSKQAKLLEKPPRCYRNKVTAFSREKSTMSMPKEDQTTMPQCAVHVDHIFCHECNCASQFVPWGQTASQHFYARIIHLQEDV